MRRFSGKQSRAPFQDVQWRAGHTTSAVTEKYTREARYAAGTNFGEPLPPLPNSLLVAPPQTTSQTTRELSEENDSGGAGNRTVESAKAQVGGGARLSRQRFDVPAFPSGNDLSGSPLASPGVDLVRGDILETESIHVSTLEAWPGRARSSCAAPERGDALALKSLAVVASGFALACGQSSCRSPGRTRRRAAARGGAVAARAPRWRTVDHDARGQVAADRCACYRMLCESDCCGEGRPHGSRLRRRP